MKAKLYSKILLSSLIFVSFVSFLMGFYLDENSAGAGTYKGDIINVWNNLQIFISNDIISSIQHEDYYSSRTPLAYIIHKIFNPLTDNLLDFRKSVFLISLTLPILFFLSLKQRFTKDENILLLLVSSILFLSPYYRTTSYWALEENYGLIFLLLSFISINGFLKSESFNKYKINFLLFSSTFFSSCCVYFDQKLIIIPIICLIKIITSEKLSKLKILAFFYYFLFSIPYIYLIFLWGSLIPSSVSQNLELGSEIFLIHIGYTLTIIAFYLFPILMFKGESIMNLIKKFFTNKRNYYLIFLFFIYLFYLIGFYDFNEQSVLGKGIIHKISLILFEDNFLRMIFVYFSFFISWLIILIYLENKFVEIITIIYLLIFSVFKWPIHQEYFDPLMLLMVFTFFSTSLFINYKNSIILYTYLFILLISSNIYYTNVIN